MNYIKKMCILRQIRQGFSGDGKTLSGLIKIEQYGKNLAVEVSVINFAPLVSGEYYCLLSDGKGKTEMLTLRGKSLFNLLSDLDISAGFCGIICYVKNEVVPIAYGINGNKSYDWRSILNATLPPVFPHSARDFNGEIAETAPTDKESAAPLAQPVPAPAPLPQATEDNDREKGYDDDTVATNNYYEEEGYERIQPEEAAQDAGIESADQKQGKKKRSDGETDENAKNVRCAVKTDPDGYYLAVKEELDKLFKIYPKDRTLDGAFSCSEWVRVKGTSKKPEYLVGVLRMDGRAHYICYALRAEDKDAPPDEIKNVCAFVPVSPYDDTGYFVIFQSAATGECIRPERV